MRKQVREERLELLRLQGHHCFNEYLPSRGIQRAHELDVLSFTID